MTLGLPPHLAARAANESFLRALHTVALTSLAGAFVIALVFQAERPRETLWPAMIAVLPMAVMLWRYRRSRSLVFSISYLVVGAASTFWYLTTFYTQSPPILPSDAFSIALPKIALLMVGGVGLGAGMRLVWCVIGYLTAETVGVGALLVTGHAPSFDRRTFLAFAVTIIMLGLTMLSQRQLRRSRPLLHRVARDEQVASIRYRIEVKAAALMHDTVLSHLAAIANSSGSELSPKLQTQIERDLNILVGEEWLGDVEPSAGSRSTSAWTESGLYGAIQESRALGLDIEPTGDLSAVSRLDRETSIALGHAVKQCLVNVLRHSGTTRAEVVAYGTDDEVSVMVIDGGRGFSEAQSGGDRLGLRNSVRRRMESVGAAVHVWSTPGRGTSIMIRIPVSRSRAAGAESNSDGSGDTDPVAIVRPS
jgi:hypothetical protein